MKRIISLLFAVSVLFTANTAKAQDSTPTVAEQAITGLLNRIGGEGAAEKFEFAIDASLAENGKDVFVISEKDGKPFIKGNSQLSVTTGINWYLNHYAHINLTWNNLTTDLSTVTLPVPTEEEKHVCNTTYRYDFNTCTFSYSMAFWTWERWQQEIDWMALHGINAPLNLVGLDVVTRKFLRELGVSENDINAYIAGPGFIAWFAMNNLEGWGGTINSPSTGVDMSGNPDWWYTRQEQLCRNMLQRMRELGMQPVIPGFSGQVPNCIVNYSINGFSSGDVVNNGTWAGGYTRPDILKPNTTSYQTFATVYYKHLHEVMGVSELYSIDPFHEGSLPSGVSNQTCYPNIMVELDKHFGNVEQSVKDTYKVTKSPSWIIQYWQGVPQSGAFTAMKDAGYTNRFIGLDLFADNIYADNAAKWRTTYYDTCPYIYCMLHNFGGRSGLHGRLETTMDGYFQALAKNNNCQGIGATPEGTETNPILYDMLFELPWMDVNNRPTADEWLADYAHSRYGVDSKTAPAALEALKNLKKSVWDCKVNQQGTSEAVILARPNWTINSVSSWSTSAIYWDTQDVLLAADQLYSVKDLVTANGGQDGIANYNYDFIDVVRQAMVDYAAQLLPLINAARGNDAEYTRLYQLYLQLMLDLDEMLSYDENFKLERWTSLARNIADEVSGTTENDRNWLEWNARTQVTVWSNGNTDLHDYSNRCWAGLIKDFHYKRWKQFFENNGNAFSGGWYSGFEYPWTVDFNDTYNLAGDYSKVVIPTDMTATEKAAQTFGKYFGRVKGATKNYIFPMGVATNATKSDVIPEVYRGQEVELPLAIGKEVTISSIWIDLNNDGNAGNGETLTANGNKVTIPETATIGKTTAKVTYNDGTVITFNLAIIEDITDARTVTAKAGANGSVAIEGADGTSVTNAHAVKMTATPNTGYNFEKWTDAQGNTVSNDNPFIYYGKEEATFTANFIQDKWGVVACNGAFSGDIASYAQFIHNLTLAYYNREPETIFEATAAPTEIFNTIPTIINVPQGASFDIAYDNGGSDGLKYCYFRAFIDLNSDGDFDDEGELLKEVGTNGAANTAVCSNKINVLLPYNMPLGITHMRLRFDGAWDNNSKPSQRGAKDASIRPVYEIIINVTEKSDKAATINVESNNSEWGTVEVWTDETPDGSTGTEWVVSANIPMYLRATKASEDADFLGWYDQYGRLVSTDLEYTMYAREDATYTARFRKFLEIDGWQMEYRTEPGKNIVTNKLANGVKPQDGKKYYIYAPTRPDNTGEYVNRYLYNNSGTLALNTTVGDANYMWICSVDGENYTFQNVADPTKYLKHKGLQASAYNFKLGTGDTKYEGITIYSVSDDRFLVINDDGSGFNQSTRTHDQSTEAYTTDFVFTEITTPDVVVLTQIRKSGNHDLVIPETVEILGELLKIVGFDNNLFKNNKDLWTISLPSTIEKLSDNKVFSTAVKGKGANASASADNYITTDLGTTLVAGEDWSISLTIEDNGNNFNQWGSALIATGSAPMNSTYATGFQLYMQAGGGLVVKTDVDGDGNKLTNLAKGTKYRIDIVYTHSNTKLVVTSTPLGAASASAARTSVARAASASLEITQDMSDFSVVSHAIPEGVNITNLEVNKGATPDPFEGCTNLFEIEVSNGCENYNVQDGTLYTTGGTKLHEVADEAKEEDLRALGELIDLTKALVAEVATVNPTGKKSAITLSTTAGENYYIYSNAEIREGAIENLLDNDNESYIHTTWEKNSADGLHHYLRVYLGEDPSLTDFSFSYITRNNSNTEKPKQITVAGCDTENGTYETISVLTDLPQASTATFESPAYSAKGYKYLRFMVDDTYRNLSNSGHKAYSMAKFELFKLTSSAEVATKYANLVGITAAEVENVYDKLAEALYYYNNSGTAEQMQTAHDVLKPSYDALNAKKEKILNGVYNINYKNNPIFVAYSPQLENLTGATAGFRLFDATTDNTNDSHIQAQNNAIDAKVATDALFTIVPNINNTGYSISAQGMFLGSTKADGWSVLSFTDANNAGVYLFEEAEESIFKLKSNKSDIQYVNDWGPIFGNDKSSKANLSTFTFTPVTEYTLTVPNGGITTLCLPFNVVLPNGVTAYDITKNDIAATFYDMSVIATTGDILAKNTPVIIEAEAGTYTLAITMNDEGGKVAMNGSVLRGTCIKSSVSEGNNYLLTSSDATFNLATNPTEAAANSCWMTLDTRTETPIKRLPFALTKNEENPTLYKIVIKRADDNSKVLRYDNNDDMVAIESNNPNKTWQAWYFMNSTNGITIHPYNANGKVLSADNTSNDPAKVWAVKRGEKAFYEWKLVSQANGYYNIQVHDGSNYFSNNGGESNKMGFWSNDASNDGGSLFKFIDAEFDNNNPNYYQLSDVKPTLPTIYFGASIGLYKNDTEEHRNATAVAESIIAAGSTSDRTACYNAYKTLLTARKNLPYNAPDTTKLYVIKSTASNDYCRGKYVHTYCESHVHPNASWGNHTYDQRHLLFDAEGDIEQLPLAVFQFEETKNKTQGKYKVKNLHTGLYVKSFNKDDEHMGIKADAQEVTISGVTDGQVKLQIGTNSPMHAQNDYSVIVTWGAEANNASTWTIDEVTDIDDIAFPITLSNLENGKGYATLYLNYDVTIPDGISAYRAASHNESYIHMEEVSGIIPARTAVILYGLEGDYNLKYSNSNKEQLANLFTGTLWRETITMVDDYYYILANGNNGVGMYKPLYDENSSDNEFTNQANKAYLHLEQSALQPASFSFRGINNFGPTTEIEEVESESKEAEVIYDLQGRKLNAITKPGLYIVNGNRVLVK